MATKKKVVLKELSEAKESEVKGSKAKGSEVKVEAKGSEAKGSEDGAGMDVEKIKTDLSEIKELIKSFKRDLKGLIEIQQRLIHERLGVPNPSPPDEYGEEPSVGSKQKSKGLIKITKLENGRIRVAGNTFDFKSAIKEAGQPKWEQETKSWSLPLESLDQLIKNLEAVNLVKNVDFILPVEKTGTGTGAGAGAGAGTGTGAEEGTPFHESDDEGFGSGF